MILLPEMVQTIVKCISASSNIVSAELSQEIFQINVQSRLLLDQKPTGATNPVSAASSTTGSTNPSQAASQLGSLSAAQTAAATAAVKSLVGVGATPGANPAVGGQQGQQQGAAAFDIIQSMINLNMNAAASMGANANAAANFNNSPGKLILSQLSSGGLNPSQLNITNALTSECRFLGFFFFVNCFLSSIL